MSMHGWSLSRLFCWLLLLASPLGAREKTDLVVLKNGNQVNCAIQTLSRGILSAKTDSMDTVKIKWQDVRQVHSPFLFLVQDINGNLYLGSLQHQQDQDRLKVEGPDPSPDLDYASVVDIREYYGSRWQRFSGAVDLSYSYTKASDRTQFNLSGDLAYRTERFTGQFTYNSTIGTSQGEKDSDRDVYTLGGSIKVAKHWYAYSQWKYEHNLELQLDRRGSLLGGPMYSIVRSNRVLVSAGSGASYSRESYYAQEVNHNAEMALMVDAQFFKLYSPKVDISSQYQFLPNLSTWGRIRSELNTNLRVEVLRDFYVTFNFYDSYDSHPPSETATRHDYGITTGISWSFRR
jgi:hypothetical protein